MQSLNKKKLKEVINVEQGKYEVSRSNLYNFPSVETYEFKNSKNDKYLILYSTNPPFQRQFYNNYKFKNYSIEMIQPDFGKFDRGRLIQDITNDRDVLNIYATLGNHVISKFKSLENTIPENKIVLYSIGARNIEPKKQKLYKKLIDKFITNLNSVYLGEKEVSYAGFDLKMNLLMPKVVYDRLQNNNELNDFLSMLDLSPLEENFINYLAKRLNISLSEARILEKEIKNYSKIKELDMQGIKKGLVTGAMVGASLLPSSKDASSNYFNMTSYNLDKGKLLNLPIEEQIKIYQNALDHLHKSDSERYRIEKIIDNLKKKLRKEKRLKIQKRQQLEEISWKDISKGITIASIVASSFIPSLQKVTAEGCDESSCSIEALEAKQTIESKIDKIDNYLKKVNLKNVKASQEERDFLNDDLDTAKNRLDTLLKQNLNKEQKKYVMKLLKKINDTSSEIKKYKY